MGVGKSQSEDSFVSFGAKPTQRACARDFPRDRKRTRKGRSQSQEKEAEQTSRQRTGRSAGESRRLLGCVDPEIGLANVRGWVSIPGDFVGISLEYTLAIACRCTESSTKMSQTSPFLHLELTQVRVCLFSFLPLSRLCMLCFVCP